MPYVSYPVVVYDDETDYVLLPEEEEDNDMPAQRRRHVRGHRFNDIVGADIGSFIKSIHEDPKTPRIHIGFLTDCVVGALWG